MRALKIALVLGLLLFAGLSRSLDAQSPPAGAFPSLSPDPLATEFARRDTGAGYTWEDLAEIALWASAVADPANTGRAANSPSTAAYLNTLRLAVEELRAELSTASQDATAPGGNRLLPGDYILGYMHRKFLTSYSTFQTRLDTLLSNGRYNCVSSAVMYLILAQSQGLTAQGVITKDHAFVTVRQGDESWDVETTNSYGFDPGNRKEFQDRFGKSTGFAYVPARNYRDRGSVSPLELVSLILSNRIAETENRGRYGDSVPLAVNRAYLLAGRRNPSPAGFFTDPQQELQARILNYGASLLRAGKEEEGLRWAAFSEPVYAGIDDHWQEYINALVNNRVAKLCRARQFDTARGFLADAQTLLDPGAYRAQEIIITDNELATLINGIKQADDTMPVITRIDQAESAGLLSTARARELRGNISRWRTNDFHNRFADAFNKRDYPLARRILDEALAEFPDNRQLRTDRGILDKAAPLQ